MIDRMHKSQKKAEGCSPGTGNQMRTRKDEATGTLTAPSAPSAPTAMMLSLLLRMALTGRLRPS